MRENNTISPMAYNAKSGFTIVELLVVIAVIGILAAITTVSYTGMQERSRVASRQADAQAVSGQAYLLQLDGGYPFTDGRTWKQALINAKLYDATSLQNTTPTKTMAFCSNSTDFVVAAWPAGSSESDIVDLVVSYGRRVSSLHWDKTVTGASTLEKICKQVSITPVTYSNWAHNPGIRDATL